ncbi:MAG: hypothetical protein WBW44_05070, partial [Solirubrobacterales bacterium]
MDGQRHRSRNLKRTTRIDQWEADREHPQIVLVIKWPPEQAATVFYGSPKRTAGYLDDYPTSRSGMCRERFGAFLDLSLTLIATRLRARPPGFVRIPSRTVVLSRPGIFPSDRQPVVSLPLNPPAGETQIRTRFADNSP